MPKFYARAQGDDARIREVSSQLPPPCDLQAGKLVQRFAFAPEMTRAYADIAFNPGARS
jgi:hypothetical protein